MTNSDEIREILAAQFSLAAEKKHDRVAAAHFEKPEATAGEIDPVLLDAYSELFDDVVDSEAEGELMSSIGEGWFPENATEYVQRYIALRTTGR